MKHFNPPQPTVCCAAGDDGSRDQVDDGLAHCDFPASSAYVLACGGTTLQSSGAGITSETVWNDGPNGGATGGGISDSIDLPAWQANANVPPSVNPGGRIGRGVPRRQSAKHLGGQFFRPAAVARDARQQADQARVSQPGRCPPGWHRQPRAPADGTLTGSLRWRPH